MRHTGWQTILIFCFIFLFVGSVCLPAATDSLDINLSERYVEARTLYYEGSPEKALAIFKAIIDEEPTGELSRNSYYFAGKILKETEKHPARALDYLYRVYEEFEPSNLTDDVLFYIAEIMYSEFQQKKMALPYLTFIIEHFPEEDYHPRAQELYQRLTGEEPVEVQAVEYEQLPPPTIRFNFENIDIVDFIHTYSDLTGSNFVYEPGLSGSVTMIGQEGVAVKNLFDVFLNVLDIHGYTVIEKDGMLHVEQMRQAIDGGVPAYDSESGLRLELFELDGLPGREVLHVLNRILPDYSDIRVLSNLDLLMVSSRPKRLKEVRQMLTGLKLTREPEKPRAFYIYEPRYTRTSDLKPMVERALEDIVSSDGYSIIEHRHSNTLILISSEEKIDRVAETVSNLDRDIIDHLELQVFHLNHADANEVKEHLEQILQVLPSEFLQAHVKIVADVRQKALIVSSTSDRAFSMIERAIKDLDKRDPTRPDSIRVFRLEHAEPEQISDAINELIEVLPGQYPPGEIRILPDRRQRAVIASAESRGVFDAIAKIVDELDRESVRPELRHHVHKLRNSQAGPLAEKLNFLFEGEIESDVRVTADEQTNSLIISAAPDDFELIQDTIEKLDSPKHQIMVGVFIVEASTDKVERLGVEWASEGSVDGRDAMVGTNFGLRPQAEQGTLFGFQAGMFDRSGDRLLGLLHAFEQESDFSILSTAHLMANEHEQASLAVGDIVPLLKAAQTTDVGTITRNFDFETVGIKLDIIPYISGERSVTLNVHQAIEEVVSVEELGAPTRKTRDINTTVAIPDRSTLVLGGVLRTTTSQSEQGVPYLRNIPILRHLFGTSDINAARQNLLIFLTPYILDTPDLLEEATERLQRDQGLEDPRQKLHDDTGIHFEIETDNGAPVDTGPSDRD